MDTLLEISGLKTEFGSGRRTIPAVDGVDLSVGKGEIVGVVGESGCGKSVTSLSVMRLLPRTGARIAAGSIRYNGADLLKLSEDEMRSIRGNEIAMIFQDPMTSLNPVHTIGAQLSEAVMLHRKLSKKEALRHVVDMMRSVHIPGAERLVREYPHRLSGGMRQRVMIAMAMSCNPGLLIADEPTTALDVTIQAQILGLMRELQREQGTSILFITHDLGVVYEMCQRVVVMYAGQIVEEAEVAALFENPSHPYTRGLMRSIPRYDRLQKRLDSIPGQVPMPGSVRQGCRFASRCPEVQPKCLAEAPPLFRLDDKRKSRCWLHEQSAVKETDGI
ncbi:ABC transporter ATP-binding protein [Paenibacillus humicola]|uniref:ABC transporter ATP-binding protein n=1 Tax=Paenibacillus humicola TaxID=3110540 RepID=UPI00237B3F72|nr:ABC transporter ATP-binding protein [Paenibacillus humicola]